jgi:adenylate cyclase
MKLVVVEDARSCEVELAPGAILELGRQNREELDPGQGPFTVHRGADGVARRVVIAWNSETAVARQHLGAEALADGRVRLTNLSTSVEIPLPDGRPALRSGQSADVTPPVRVALPRRTILIEPATPADHDLHRLTQFTLAPGAPLASAVRPPPAFTGPQFDQLIDWLQTTLGVLQGALGAADFLSRAAEALVSIVGLGSGWVLLRHDGRWGSRPENARGADAWRPSDAVLETLVRERRTVWNRPAPGAEPAALSVFDGVGMPHKEVVAAPLLDAAGGVVGALYGELPAAPAGRVEGGPAALKAALVEILACGVSAGLARQRHEREAAHAQALFGQFFSESLARQLRAEPDMLAGRTATVTVLFCDVRGYSAISGRIGAADTERWLHDVLGELSRCVLDEDGVLVDYYGDGLLAMWGAPVPQPDQSARAGRAALAMLRAVPPLNARWRGVLGGDVDVGIGIHRGEAQVGNCGSAYKFKYGPLGETVNVASRAEGLTKYLKCRLLVTGPVREHLTDDFAARRVVRARLVNIAEPVGLYALAEGGAGVGDFCRASEAALDALEQGEFAAATRQAGALLERFPGDGPTVLTLSRAADALVRDGRGFDPVWTPPGK